MTVCGHKRLEARTHMELGEEVVGAQQAPTHLCLLSIPTCTLPPSPPLRLLCAEAAFRGLVLQGEERARKGRLTPAKAKGRQDKRTEQKIQSRNQGG